MDLYNLPERRSKQRLNSRVLFAVQLHNQLLIDRQLNVFALGQTQHARLVIIAVDFQPVGHRAMAGEFLGQLQHGQLAATVADRDLLASTHLVGGNVDFSGVYRDVAMAHKLSRLAPGLRKTEAVDNIVQPPLQLLQEQFAGDASGARRLFKVIAELAFLGKVNALGFLLFAQLQTIADDLGLAVLTMLSRGEVTLFDRTFVAEALGAFEEQLHPLAAAETANCIGITCQVVLLLDDRFTGLASPFVPDENQWSVASDLYSVTFLQCASSLATAHLLLDSPALRRTAPIVRNRRHVANG